MIFSHIDDNKRKDLYNKKSLLPDTNRKLKKNLKENLDIIHEYLSDCEDIIVRNFYMDSKRKHEMAIIYVDGLADSNILQEEILKPLMIESRQFELEYSLGKNFYNMVEQGLVTAGEIKEVDNFGELILEVLSGETVLLLDKYDKAIVVSTRGWEKRGVSEPSTESVIRGPRDGFTETYRTNVALIRRRIKDPNLKVKTLRIGRHTRTDVGVLYIKGLANPKIVKEVVRRLNTIDMAGVLESGYIEQMIEDDWISPFPQMRRTERPDIACAGLIEGSVVIICDNTPFVLIAPATLASVFQAPEDYYERWHIATLLRIMRYAAAFLALTLPALYIAMTMYHPGMIPTDLALSIAATREGVPFSAVIEALIMVFAMEMLREAGVRLPGPIGQTIGIVGGLIVGEAAVRASIVSPFMVIIVAIDAICSFAIPNYSVAISFRILTFVFMFLAAAAGLYGIMLGLIALTIHLATLKSFGAVYLSPFTDLTWRELKDTIMRAPFPSMKIRPQYNQPLDNIKIRDLRDNAKETSEDEKDANR